jgi:hypothetical protein
VGERKRAEEFVAVTSNALKASFVYAPPVGGVVPIDKLGLLAPYIDLASTITVATVATSISSVLSIEKRNNEHHSYSIPSFSILKIELSCMKNEDSYYGDLPFYFEISVVFSC